MFGSRAAVIISDRKEMRRRAHRLARRARVWPRWCAGGRLEQERRQVGTAGRRRARATERRVPRCLPHLAIFVFSSSPHPLGLGSDSGIR